MPRKYRNLDHLLVGDPVYNDRLLTKFINNVMREGKKATAERIFYGALKLVEEREKEKPSVEIFRIALDNCAPRVEVKSRRVGGATYQVPVPVKEKRRYALAMKWLLTAARGRKGKPMAVRLAEEVLAAYKMDGAAVKKREDVHKMAESNRAFAHLAY